MSTVDLADATVEEVVAGDPDGLRELYAKITTFSQGFEEAAGTLSGIVSGEIWVGDAAQAFLAQYDDHQADYRTAADAFGDVLRPLATYVDTLEWAQQQAEQAIHLAQQGRTLTRQWQDRAAGATTDPGPDPGAADTQRAVQMVTDLRQRADDDGRALGRAAEDSAGKAPVQPGFLARAWHDVTEFAGGLADSVGTLLQFVMDFNPMRMYVDPIGYFESTEKLAKGLWFGVQHPLELGKAMIDWKDWESGNYARAIGELVPQVALTLATMGGGAAAEGADAAATLERVGASVGELSANDALYTTTSDAAKLQRLADLGLDAGTPAGKASLWQMGEPYDGVDSWSDATMKAGDRVAFGTPGITGFGVPPEVVGTGDAQALFEGVQAGPKRVVGLGDTFADTAPAYRPRVEVYEATGDLDVATSQALANPQFGAGGLSQVYVPNVGDLIDGGVLRRVDSVPLDNVGAGIEDPAFRAAAPYLPTSPLTVAGAQRAGAVQGGLVGAGIDTGSGATRDH